MDALTRQKLQLVDNMRRLSSTEHDEVFKLLRQNNIKFTQNSNGVWCDLFSVDAGTIQLMTDLVDFYCCNKVELDEFEQRLAEAKMKNSVYGCGTTFVHAAAASRPAIDDVLSLCDKKAKKALVPYAPATTAAAQAAKKTTTARFMLAKKRYSKRSTKVAAVEADDELQPDEAANSSQGVARCA